MAKKKRPGSSGMYAIRPMGSGHGGWYVEFVRQGISHRRCFSVARFGDLGAALAAAQAWRDQAVKNKKAATKAQYSQQVRANNTSGFPGVYLRTQRRRNAAGQLMEYRFWQALTPDSTKPGRSKSFSVAVYGHQRAFELACQARQAFVRELKGYYLPANLPPDLRPAFQETLPK